MASPVIINLTYEEKAKLIQFLTEKKVSYSRKVTSLEREYQILLQFQSSLRNTPESYVSTLNEKVKTWLYAINNTKLTISKFDKFIESIVNGTVYNIREAPEASSLLRELQQQEREAQQLSHKYKYYPRLKKAKEASLYVFSNKIKSIMECEHVKVA